MRRPEHFEVLNEDAVFRPMGRVSLDQAAELVTEGIAYARSLNICKLLIDLTNLTGFESPDIFSRYFIIQEWADAAGPRIRVAIVVRPEIIDPYKFGTTVAGNIGFRADIFTTEGDALIWLELVK